jgi:hypothetical protein
MYSTNAYISALHAYHFLYATIEKGLTNIYACKPLLILVGGTGFEQRKRAILQKMLDIRFCRYSQVAANSKLKNHRKKSIHLLLIKVFGIRIKDRNTCFKHRI